MCIIYTMHFKTLSMRSAVNEWMTPFQESGLG
jgi:hypothetical protein